MSRLKKYINWGTFLLVWMCLYSCSFDEQAGKEGEPPPVQTTINIPMTRGTLSEESLIAKGRVIICESSSGLKIANLMHSNPNDTIFTTIVQVGTIDIYLIANEDPAWNLGSITTRSQLKAILQNYAACPIVDATHQIPMFGMFESVYVNESGGTFQGGSPIDLNKYASTVKRIFSKVTLDIQCNFLTDLSNGGEPVDIKSVTVKRLPKSSYLAPLTNPYPYNTGTYFFDGTTPYESTYTPTSSSFNGHYAFYIPEYIIGDTSLYSYLSIIANLRANPTDPSTQVEYKIVIGDGIGDNKNSYLLGNLKTLGDLRVTRNTHYWFKSKLVSYQHTSEQELVISAKVLDWDQNVNDDFDYTDHFFYIYPYQFVSPTSTYTGVINIETNAKDGWTASVSGPSGGIATCTLIGNTTNQPSGQLKFNFSSTQINSYKTITITSGKVEKMVTVTRIN